jgi:hypothetical protein
LLQLKIIVFLIFGLSVKFVATTEIVCRTVYSVWGVCVVSDEDDFPPPAQDDPAPQFQRRNEEEVAPVGEDEELPVQDMCVVSDGDDFPPPAQDDPAPQPNEEEVAPVGEDEHFPVQDMRDVEDLPLPAQDDSAPQHNEEEVSPVGEDEFFLVQDTCDVPDKKDLPPPAQDDPAPQFQEHGDGDAPPVSSADDRRMFGSVNVLLDDNVEVLEVLGDEEDFLFAGEDEEIRAPLPPAKEIDQGVKEEEPCSASDQGVPASSCSRSLSLLLGGERAAVTAPRLI